MRTKRTVLSFNALKSVLAIAFAVALLSTAHAQQQPAQTSPITTPATGNKSDSSFGAQGAPSIKGDDREIVHSDLVTFNVTVTDQYGRFVSGLGKSHFTVLDDKTQQEITFFSDDDAPVSLGIIFDVSGSMGKDKIVRAKEALRHFIETSKPGDEYFLIGFNERAQLLLDRTRDSDALLDKMTFIQSKGQTAVYDACYLGVEKVQRGTHQKKALLVISDGQDNSSRYTFSELRRMLKESDVIIYGIGIENPGDTLAMQGQAVLDELAAVTGGKAFYPNGTADMNDIFERIALELRHQYSIGYRPTNFANDGKWHKLKVNIKPPRGLPHLFVRSKDGYFALANPK